MHIIKHHLILLLAIVISPLFLHSPADAEKFPQEIGGIALGSNVKTYPHLTQSNYLKDVVVTDWHGYRKGVISYGACQHVDEILKIDLKYEQKDKKFYKKLLKKFKQNFGDPDQWKGDSFGLVHIWKWYFTDEKNNRISLILQHNSKNSNETIGNMVKLSYPNKIADEKKCFAHLCADNQDEIDAKMQEEMKKTGWSYLIPR